MSTYQYEGFLTEQKLGECLKFLFGEDAVTPQSPVLGMKRSRWDYKVDYGEALLFFEFDGHFHYTNPTAIVNDQRKTKIGQQQGAVFRVPYFVQLDSAETFLSLATTENKARVVSIFRELLESKKVSSSYPHGFCAKKVVLPSEFCTHGALRFWKELDRIPVNVRADIVRSLRDIEKAKPDALVWPLSVS